MSSSGLSPKHALCKLILIESSEEGSLPIPISQMLKLRLSYTLKVA